MKKPTITIYTSPTQSYQAIPKIYTGSDWIEAKCWVFHNNTWWYADAPSVLYRYFLDHNNNYMVDSNGNYILTK